MIQGYTIYSNFFIEKKISRCNTVTYMVRAIDFSVTALQHFFSQRGILSSFFERESIISHLPVRGCKNHGF
jgi:hypothetical protein